MIDIETQKKYDSVCAAIFVNLYGKSAGRDIITLAYFNPETLDHLCILGVAKGIAGAYGKTIKLNLSKKEIKKLNKQIKDKNCYLEKATDEDMESCINVAELIRFMYPSARNFCGDEFTFADIYNEFYKITKEK